MSGSRFIAESEWPLVYEGRLERREREREVRKTSLA